MFNEHQKRSELKAIPDKRKISVSKNIDHDQIFKQLLTVFFLEFLELFTPEFFAAIDPQSIEVLPLEYFTDIKIGERKAMDVIIRVNLLGRPNAPASGRVSVVVNCEHQSSTQADFNRRMFFYFTQLHRKYLQPVYPIALFSFDNPLRAEQNSYQVRVPGLQVMDFNFLAIQLNRLNWKDFLTHSNPVAAALMSKMSIATKDRPKVKAECLRLLVTLKLDPAKSRLISKFVDTYLRLNVQEESTFQSEIDKMGMTQKEKIMQTMTSWEEKGVEKGLERGLDRQRSTILRQLTRKIDRKSVV